jgi:Domain of unknown function (DU1801)
MRSPGTGPAADEVSRLLDTVADGDRRNECVQLIGMMRHASGEDPELWGNGTIGFGRYHYRYASGRQGDWFKVGFAPRSTNTTVYVMSGFVGYDDLLSELGRYRRGKSCLYLRRLTDVDPVVLGALIERCIEHLDQVEANLGAIPRMSAMPPFEPRGGEAGA